MFPETIGTDRLLLVRCCRDTLSALDLYEHMRAGAPHMDEVSRYVIWEPHDTPKDSHDYLDEVEQQWAEREQATYVVYPREGEDDAGEFAGLTNLHFHWDVRAAELGIWLHKPFWGRGYSGERAAALYELAFERLDLEVVGATYHGGNENSKRAIEKYVEAHGGQYDGVRRNAFRAPDGEIRDFHRYSVTSEQYFESQQ
ncbi:GNAT family N-acetyltransferase [Haloarchaeobius sp. DFWS5]|uniref:GNAT family N-acetyltransferase n=1 Tax=Haloarchaeobius sp. DFWS5 TaxID=3446114 RepID=UPI003EB6D729